MIKKILVSVCLLLASMSFAQEGSYSPYSFYGIGDQRFKGTVDTRAMGGLSIFPDSIHVNLSNPASFSSLKMTTLTFGATGSWANLNTEQREQSAQRVTLDYLAVGLPMKKAGIVFGLMPYSSVGFRVRSSAVVDGDENDVITRKFNGTGGINRAFLGFGYEITKNFRAGVNANYNFGKIETTSLATRTETQFGTREINNSKINGLNFDFGLMYEGKVNNKLRAFGGVTYSPASNLTNLRSRMIATVQLLNLGGLLIVDQDTIPRDQIPGKTFKIPSQFSIGAGIGEPRKWQVGAEVTFKGAKDMANRYDENSGNSAVFENAIKYNIGGYYIPNYNSYSSYWSRVVLRAGARYENTGLVLNSKTIYDAAGTVGFGLPLMGTFSNINLALEYGKRGTKAYGLVEEKYFNLSVGLSFNDRWFVKRKYD